MQHESCALIWISSEKNAFVAKILHFLEVSARLRYNAPIEVVLFRTKQHLFFNMWTVCLSSLWYIEFAAMRLFFLLSSLGWWQILIIWLSFTTITLTKMSYIPFIGMESGNLSKLLKGKFLEMFLNIVIKNWLNQYRKKCGYWGVWRKPLTHCNFDAHHYP